MYVLSVVYVIGLYVVAIVFISELSIVDVDGATLIIILTGTSSFLCYLCVTSLKSLVFMRLLSLYLFREAAGSNPVAPTSSAKSRVSINH